MRWGDDSSPKKRNTETREANKEQRHIKAFSQNADWEGNEQMMGAPHSLLPNSHQHLEK